MPKKSKKRHPRRPPPASRPAAPSRRPAPSSAARPASGNALQNLWLRARRRPATTALIILGLLVVVSMVLALVVPMLTPSAPPTPTPTVAPVTTPSPTPRPTPPPAPTKASKSYPAAPAMSIDPTKAYTATVETTNGPFVIRLLPDVAPQTVNNFVFLARDGFYDGLTFHRVEDWVVQGGDPLGTGMGGPGYTIPAEFASSQKYSQVRGIVGMARAQDPNSGGSQWYVVKKDATWLDGQYTTFGRVVSGMDVVDTLVIGDWMIKVTITEGQ